MRDLHADSTTDMNAVAKLFELAYSLRSRYFRTLFYYRTGHLFSKILSLFYPGERTFIIDKYTKIGPGLQLAHPYATIINAEHMGENCYINHLVTIGQKNGQRPKIGDNVQFLSNCTVIGGINIGDRAVIGAGAVVISDVPADSIAVGNPARFVARGT